MEISRQDAKTQRGQEGGAARREPTAFEKRIYEATSGIPRGSVATYGELARHIGCNSARAVAQALRRNPYAPEVPCHRVIASDLTIGGFAGTRTGPQIGRKRRLLKREGVRFSRGRLADTARLFTFGRG